MSKFREVRLLLVASVLTMAGVAALLTTPRSARATGADCSEVQTAVTLQSKTPFHAVLTKTPTRGTFKEEKTDMVWIGNEMYMSMGGRWVGAPMSPDNVLDGIMGGNLPFSECKRLPDTSIGGQPVSAYSAKMESGEHAQLFISTKTGQIVRDIVDEDIMTLTGDFDYTNVHAPALAK